MALSGPTGSQPGEFVEVARDTFMDYSEAGEVEVAWTTVGDARRRLVPVLGGVIDDGEYAGAQGLLCDVGSRHTFAYRFAIHDDNEVVYSAYVDEEMGIKSSSGGEILMRPTDLDKLREMFDELIFSKQASGEAITWLRENNAFASEIGTILGYEPFVFDTVAQTRRNREQIERYKSLVRGLGAYILMGFEGVGKGYPGYIDPDNSI